MESRSFLNNLLYYLDINIFSTKEGDYLMKIQFDK